MLAADFNFFCNNLCSCDFDIHSFTPMFTVGISVVTKNGKCFLYAKTVANQHK